MPSARSLIHGTHPAPVRSTGAIRSSRSGGPTRVVTRGLAVATAVGLLSNRGDAEARERRAEAHGAGVFEPTAPNQGLCASPCSLAGIA